MKKLIKDYLKLCITSKKGLNKQINELNKCVKQLFEVTAGQQRIIEEYTKDSYKTKFHNEHKKYKELEKESREIIEEFKNEVTKLERENRKLKEVHNG